MWIHAQKNQCWSQRITKNFKFSQCKIYYDSVVLVLNFFIRFYFFWFYNLAYKPNGTNIKTSNISLLLIGLSGLDRQLTFYKCFNLRKTQFQCISFLFSSFYYVNWQTYAAGLMTNTCTFVLFEGYIWKQQNSKSVW